MLGFVMPQVEWCPIVFFLNRLEMPSTSQFSSREKCLEMYLTFWNILTLTDMPLNGQNEWIQTHRQTHRQHSNAKRQRTKPRIRYCVRGEWEKWDEFQEIQSFKKKKTLEIVFTSPFLPQSMAVWLNTPSNWAVFAMVECKRNDLMTHGALT